MSNTPIISDPSILHAKFHNILGGSKESSYKIHTVNFTNSIRRILIRFVILFVLFLSPKRHVILLSERVCEFGNMRVKSKFMLIRREIRKKLARDRGEIKRARAKQCFRSERVFLDGVNHLEPTLHSCGVIPYVCTELRAIFRGFAAATELSERRSSCKRERVTVAAWSNA